MSEFIKNFINKWEGDPQQEIKEKLADLRGRLEGINNRIALLQQHMEIEPVADDARMLEDLTKEKANLEEQIKSLEAALDKEDKSMQAVA